MDRLNLVPNYENKLLKDVLDYILYLNPNYALDFLQNSIKYLSILMHNSA